VEVRKEGREEKRREEEKRGKVESLQVCKRSTGRRRQTQVTSIITFSP
jgi:hypothetical protein